MRQEKAAVNRNRARDERRAQRGRPEPAGYEINSSVLIELLMPRAQSITAGASFSRASAMVQRLVGATTCTAAGRDLRGCVGGRE